MLSKVQSGFCRACARVNGPCCVRQSSVTCAQLPRPLGIKMKIQIESITRILKSENITVSRDVQHRYMTMLTSTYTVHWSRKVGTLHWFILIPSLSQYITLKYNSISFFNAWLTIIVFANRFEPRLILIHTHVLCWPQDFVEIHKSLVWNGSCPNCVGWTSGVTSDWQLLCIK